ELDRLSRQFDRLHKLTSALESYQPRAWQVQDQSFDPLQVLQELEDSGTEPYDRLFLVGHDVSTAPTARVEQLLGFTSVALDHSPVCAFWLGEDGRLIYVNRAACASLGYARSELLGMHIS